MKSLIDLLGLDKNFQFVDLENCEIAFVNFKSNDYVVWNKLTNAVNLYAVKSDSITEDLRFILQDNNFLQSYKNYDFILIRIAGKIFYLNTQYLLKFRLWNSDNGLVCLGVKFNWIFNELESQSIKDRLFFNNENIKLQLIDYKYNDFTELDDYLEKLSSI